MQYQNITAMIRSISFRICLLAMGITYSGICISAQNISFVREYYASSSIIDCFALVANRTNHEISLHLDNRYWVKEMFEKEIRFMPQYKNNFFSFQCAHFGYSKFGNLDCALGYTRAFGKRFAMGLQLFYLFSHAENYQKKHSFTFDYSVIINATDKLGFYFYTYNPACLKYSFSNRNPIPTRFNFACFYQINKKLLISTQISKIISENLNIQTSIFYKQTFWATHCQLSLIDIQMGFDFWWNHFSLGTKFTYNYHVGFSNHLSISFLY